MASMASMAKDRDRRWTRRRVLKAMAAAGVGSAAFGRALTALAGGAAKVSSDMIRDASWVSGLRLTGKQRKLMLEDLGRSLADYTELRSVPLDNAVAPAFRFDPDPAGAHRPLDGTAAASPEPPAPSPAPANRPAAGEDLAFAPVTTLAELLRTRQVSAVELTRLYLERLRRHDPILQCVVTCTEDLALRQAEAADRELAAGKSRGPLHGIPWGAKDLLAVPGYPTTWGAGPFREQARPEKATAAARLDEAGAVLLAKLTVGELAWGDVWFGGTTKNPWKTDQGSSGSSAGSAAAVAAGLTGFALGTETWGSIVSPATRCGASGLRPTFGRVSRHGAMALAWTMDKIGVLARSAGDLALVLAAIHGEDGLDPAAVSRPFDWPVVRPRTRKLGYAKALFDEDYTKWADEEAEKPGLAEWKAHDERTLATLEEIGFELVPIELESAYPVGALALILTAEAATAFDELTRSGRDALLVRQTADAWPNVFREGQLIPAVEYLRAQRIRSLLMREMEEMMASVDVYVAPTYGGDNLLRTNLTGHPAVVVPNGFRASDGTPTSITFTGRLFGESEVLAVAREFQEANDFHRRRPPLLPAPAPAPR